MSTAISSSSSALTGLERALVVIGGSAGALDPLLTLVGRLGPSFPLPIAAVVHTPRDRPSALPKVLAARCGLSVREAEDKEPLSPGTLYLAPSDYHLLIDRGPSLSLSIDHLVNFSRPSIDVLFESAAELLGEGVLAVLLSGASADGARGTRAILDHGGAAIVQNPAEAASREMPEAAIALGPEASIMSVAEMAEALARLGPGAREGWRP